MDRGAGSATVHRVAKSWTRLSEFASLHFTGKTMVLTIWTFVGRAISVYNMLSRFVIAFVPRNKWFFLFVCLFVFVFNFMATVTICSDFGAQENKFCHCSHCFPRYLS